MRFLRELVVKRRNGQKLRNKLKGKKKQKRLDAICEKAYNRSHGGVKKVESSEFIDKGNELELRRSSRARKPPVLLDSSPQPPKKRRKVDRSGVSNIEKVQIKDVVKCGTGDSSARDFDGQIGGWGTRLRSRGNNGSFSRRKRRESSPKGKRKLFEDLDGFRNGTDPQCNDEKDEFLCKKSKVVKSKRPRRIKASDDLEKENQEMDLRGGIEDCKDNRMDDVFEPMDKEDDIPLRNKFDSRSELGVHDGCIPPKLVEEETTVQIESQVEECHTNGIVERKENAGLDKLACDLEHQRNDIEVNCAADQAIEGPPDKLLEGEKCEKSVEKCNDLNAAEHKPRLKLGRRCGLCGGGTDGKPPKILLLDGDSSGNEAYSGSSASEESNYDVFDGFGDDSEWLGRLLGPINDRFGIAGIWVHQQCAVWSPEVYFAGLGCLKNIRAALFRGRVLKCNRCMRPGATIGCHVDRCPKTYHLPCARAKGCTFDHRKFLIACTDHGHPFQPYGMKNELRLKKIKSKKMKLELRKTSNGAYRKDIEAEEKWLENLGEDEEFLKRESKRLHRDLGRIAPVYIGGANSVSGTQFQGWESVAGLQGVIQCMKEVVILPLLYPEFFSNIGLTPPRGVLLHGYPGTGKTLVVRALVGACARGDKRIAYFARKGADCLGKYVGDAERQLRLLFQVAEKSQPSIIFFDEIDGLAPCRTKQQDQTHSSVVSTLLALMDGLKSRGSVVVIGATNRPDAVDPALRRPGRFDREIYFPLPSVKDREAILSLHSEKWPKPIAGSLLKSIAKQTIGYAGADLQALCTRAAIIALRKSFPLQEVLSTSKDEVSHSKYPSIPNFFVDEKDWLQALTCAPPPCSRREYGIAVNDVFTSPLTTFLVPCLLQPLLKLLVCLYLDERVWLTPALSKASMLVKKVIVSALDDRRVPSDAWWSHIDDVLQDVSVANEIEKNFLLADVLLGKTNLCSSDVTEEFDAETYSKNLSSNPQCMVAHSGLLQNMSYKSSNKSGFQLLISGNPRSGQRHLASCLLHCFVGNVDVWKVDLASISHEGHGDMIQGLTRILIRCASANMCMIYMPRIDLWAIETYKESSKDHHESDSMEPESSGKLSSNGIGETDKQPDICSNTESEGTESQNYLIKASYLWTSFIEHVESMRVNTSLIILATSELPFSTFPHRVRQFFGSEIVNCSLSVPMNHNVPRFCVQLDGNFDHDKIMKTAALMLTKDLTQQFIQSIQSRNHTQKNSLEEKDHDKVNGDHLSTKSSPVSPLNSVAVMNKTMKGKSSLLLAISTVGYQILCYPHFAELCWVTSKLKAGPFANISGPTKGWPFNSCIIRPIVSSTDKVVSPSGNSKSKESSVVRGLVAVGLSAYRGEYTSLREICSEVRKVLETLVGRIDYKIQAGKDGSQFFRLLSQVAHLEDMIISWAHNLRSLEADTPISEANNVCTESLDNYVSKDDKSDGDGNKLDGSNLIIQETEKLGCPLDITIKCAGDSVPKNGDNVCQHAPDEVPVASEGPSELGSLDPSTSYPVKNSSLPIVDNLQTSTESEFVGNAGSTKLSNGFMNFFDFQENGSCGPVNHGVELFPCTEVSNQPNGQSLIDNNIFSTNTNESSRGNDFDAKTASTLPGNSSVTCFYQCCSECFANLYNLLLRIVTSEWGAKGGNDLTVEAIHDFVASLSVNLHLILGKLSEDQSFSSSTCNESSKAQKFLQCRKSKETDMSECKNSEKNWIMTECSCHTSEGSTNKEKFPETSLENESTFVIKIGVLAPVETGIDLPYHCKFEKLCLCSVTEWLAMKKEPFD